MRSSRLRRAPIALALASLLGALVALPTVRAEEHDPNAAVYHEVWFPSADGTVLHADVFLPASHVEGERHPVILNAGPYSGRTGLGPARRYEVFKRLGQIFAKGYAWVQVDTRGYGASGGCSDFGGPGEQSDVKAAVEWAATQPWSTGKVGMWGASYDAWTQVMALATRPAGLAAVVIEAPLLETYRGLYMHGVHYAGGWWGTPGAYAGIDLTPPAGVDSAPDQFTHSTTGTADNPGCYQTNLTETTNPDRAAPYWRARDLVDAAAASDVPVLWSHGFNDINTKPDNILDVFSRLRGPKRAWFGQYHHIEPLDKRGSGRDDYIVEAMSWLDHYLRGLPALDLPNIEVQDGAGRWRSEAEWPPADAVTATMPVLSGSYVDDGIANTFGSAGSYTFTPPTPYDLHLAGEAHVELSLSSPVEAANVMVRLWDVAPNGQATMITRGAHAFDRTAIVDVELFPQDWVLGAGRRLAIEVAGEDPLFQPVPTFEQVTVHGGQLRAPFLRYLRVSDIEGGPSFAQSQVLRRWFSPADFESRTASGVAFPPPLEPRAG